MRVLVATGALAASAPTAAAHDTGGATGGRAAPDAPSIDSVACADGTPWRCGAGEPVTIRGEALEAATAVTFLGRRGGRDDRRVAPAAVQAHAVSVVVPAGARSGPVRVRTPDSASSKTRRRLRIARTASAAPTAAEGVFPIRGPHQFGTSEANRFGGGRGHQGYDVFARCGTPLVAAAGGEVQAVQYHSAAGYYTVIAKPDGESHAYMHLRGPALVREGERVRAGTPIGEVGDSGRATGCHLHFELWTAPGWYRGGRPIDPLPQLKEWDAAG
jgi:murein DD-endopeptidase MepM/ murein hydrolase activator NlpD